MIRHENSLCGLDLICRSEHWNYVFDMAQVRKLDVYAWRCWEFELGQIMGENWSVDYYCVELACTP